MQQRPTAPRPRQPHDVDEDLDPELVGFAEALVQLLVVDLRKAPSFETRDGADEAA